MSQKVVLVTGGSSGIGKAICLFLKSKGYKVYGTTRNLSKHSDFTEFELLEMDVREVASIRNAVRQVLSKEESIDVLVNNAGVGITGPIEETPNEEILKAFDTNFNGPLSVAKAVLPQMRNQRKGLIINITSIAGYMGLPFRGIYSATKGALEMATEALRIEVKDFGIEVCCLAPGDFATNIASGRFHVPVTASSPYTKYQQSLETMNAHVESGQDPIKVAKKVFEIIKSSSPKVHYRVGEPMQRFSLALKRILPDKLYEKLLMNHYKL